MSKCWINNLYLFQKTYIILIYVIFKLDNFNNNLFFTKKIKYDNQHFN